ncbi:MAG: hypothetical protein PHS47_00040 [Methanocellales archaeon]|nr:hypothetical protein [Methanocellales archaeon]MDD3420681.1 hypothetical protein [Methanocellales archaeon]MDD4897853.1 hypothetical protein [Methanocellales archaeon]MDD5447384.1 hypothetical protein [Methanocellales archaeon]
MKDKLGIVAGIGITVSAVLLTLAFFLKSAGNIELSDIPSIGIVLTLVAFATFVLWDRLKNINKGLPAADERLIQVSCKAGYYGFIAAIWSAVGSNLLAEIIWDIELEGHHVAAVVVLVSAFVFAASYLYLARKGDAK